MLVSKSFRFRLKPTEKQRVFFAQSSGSCRFIYNWGLAQRIEAYEKDKSTLSYVDQANILPSLKKELEWLRDVPSQSLQQSLKDLDQAYKNFFRRVKKGETPGFPKFKRKGLCESMRFPVPPKLLDKGHVKLPKIGEVKFIQSREIEGRMRNATVRKEGKHWFISFNCEVEQTIPENHGSAVGIDRGVAKTLTTSDGVQESIPKESLTRLDKKLKRLQRKLCRQKKGSSNRQKTKYKIGDVHRKIRNIRQDWNHKSSTTIAKSHGLVVLEDLKIQNMSKSAKGTSECHGKNVKAKSGLNREILKQGWYQFQQFLTYKCEWYGSLLVLVDPKNTSMQCSSCGYTAKENRKTQAVFKCEACGHKSNADHNAAKNILARGQRVLASGATALAG
jgi:putative transposase